MGGGLGVGAITLGLSWISSLNTDSSSAPPASRDWKVPAMITAGVGAVMAAGYWLWRFFRSPTQYLEADSSSDDTGTKNRARRSSGKAKPQRRKSKWISP